VNVNVNSDSDRLQRYVSTPTAKNSFTGDGYALWSRVAADRPDTGQRPPT